MGLAGFYIFTKTNSMKKRTKQILAVIGVIIAIAFLLFVLNPDIVEIFNSGSVAP